MRGILKRISFFVVLGAAFWLAPGCGEEKTLPKPVPVMTALEPIEVSSGQTARIIGSAFPSSLIEDLSVLVGGVKAELLACEPHCITLRIPELKDGIARVVVRCEGRVLQGLSFTVVNGGGDNLLRPSTLLSACPVIKKIESDSTTRLSSGISDSRLRVRFTDDSVSDIYILHLDRRVSDASLKVALPGNIIPTLSWNGDVPMGWSKATLSSMAASMDGKDGNVVALVNGDFWNTSITIPKGPVHFRSTVVSNFWDNTESKPDQGVSFMGIRSSGEAFIGRKAVYAALADSFVELTGAGVVLVEDGKALPNSNLAKHPRNSVGINSEGDIFFLLSDGRSELSAGLHYEQMAQMLLSLGCEDAVNLDGGGSAQILVRDPATGHFKIRNKPSDGQERAVINAWAITL